MALAPLPIDAVLPRVVDAVRDRGACVVVAAPGAGKTTRVPGALVDAGVVRGEIVVLQPRRIAARLAAARVASERGVELGAEVGYEVRFDRRVSAATKIRFVTEGVLTRRLVGDGELRGVGCVVIDELHERHLDGDVALALCARLRERRPELAIVVMSATIDAAPVAKFLTAPVVESAGRAFPLTIEHEEQPDDRPLGKRVAATLRRVAQDMKERPSEAGDVLVFLPGAGEIRRCAEDVADAAALFGFEVLPLHGDLSADEQDRAVGRAPAGRRKLILATNVAETSVTIDGVTCVIDSGLARVARHSPWSGIGALQIEPVSKASCVQRAGRAGRTRPGRAVRLYTRGDFESRRAFDVPEIARADLAGVALELRALGVRGFADVRWLDAPPGAAVAAADELLARLGALTATGVQVAGPGGGGAAAGAALTEVGRRMLRFPAHPRVARLMCEAEVRGVAPEASVVAALLGARELRMERRGPHGAARIASSSDVIDDLDALLDARGGGMRADRLRRDGLDVATAMAADRAARQLERIADARAARAPATADDVDRALQLCVLTAFPDRVGRRRAPGSGDFAMAGGGSATLAASSGVLDAPLIVAVDAADVGTRGHAGKVQIRRASAIHADWLLELYFDRITERDDLVWNAAKQRVERTTAIVYDGLAIDEQRDVDGARRAGRAASEVLAREAVAAIASLVDADALAQWTARVSFVAANAPAAGVTAPTPAALAQIIARACDGLTSFAELRQLGLLALLDAELGPKKATVDRLAPTHLQLPKRRIAIHYESDRPPWIASRMQDFFGLARAPAVCDGRVPLVLHLLAPNQRPVQVTTDLPGFWVKHYPGLRKQLARKYPRHVWPEDPLTLIGGDD
nr:ATP-dependent helicase HrpB [Kofleriaceae bacterium]